MSRLLNSFIWTSLLASALACSPGFNRAASSDNLAASQEEQSSSYELTDPSHARVYVLNDGTEAAQARIDLVKRAKKSITAQYYIYSDDETSFVGLALLREAALRGVKVRIVIDAIANGIPREIREYLAQSGVEIREYHPLSLFKLHWLTRRLHDKVLIIDGLEMITGGRNIENNYYGLSQSFDFLDRDVYVKGHDVVEQAQDYFEGLWDNKKHVKELKYGDYAYKSLTSKCPSSLTIAQKELCVLHKQKLTKERALAIQKLEASLDLINGKRTEEGVEPLFTLNSNRDWAADGYAVSNVRFLSDPVGYKGKAFGIADEVVSLINMAQKSLIVENPYLVPDKQLLEALVEAVKRGVDVKILTNSSYSGDVGAVLISYYKSERKVLLDAGIKIWEYKGPDSVHSKSFVIDDRITFVGSFNFDRMSHNNNTEVGIVTEDDDVARLVSDDIKLRMNGAWEINKKGEPIGIEPGVSYPWKKGSYGIGTRILELLLPFYKRHL